MDLKTYLSTMSPQDKTAFADQVGTSPAYLSQLANGYRRAGIKSCRAIEMASGGRVKTSDLRPDLFQQSEASGSNAA